jgi:Cof subfamily protein (haloacid dehalogenase superfamily)
MTTLDRERQDELPRQRHYRMAVLDVDGTLLGADGLVSPRVRDAVVAARDSGCLVTLASGRRLWAIRPIVEALGISVPVILYNGAIVYDLAQGEATISCHLAEASLCAAIDLISQHRLQPVVYGHTRSGEPVYTGPTELDNDATIHYFDRPTTQPQRLDLAGLRKIDAPPLVAAMGGEADMRQLEQAALGAKLDCHTLVERQSFVPRSPWWQLDFSAAGCSKAAALHSLCRLHGISPSETLAVGDGINDLELIQSAGLGIAMGNAVPQVRQAAAITVADNEHDGAAQAIERFILRSDRLY